MASIHRIQKILFLAALIISQQIQFTHGRQLKAVKEHKLSHPKTETGDASKDTKFEKGLDTHKEKIKVTRSKDIFPSPTQTLSHEFSSSKVYHSEGFAPTTPGNSPGVGHSLTTQKSENRAEVQDFTPVADEINDFRPTGPGHSPGVGHAFGTKDAGTRA